MIFQNPRAALNPIRKVGRQIEDVLLQHVAGRAGALTEKAIEMLDQVRIARPRERYHAYPFELSGGMCQRVVIALALACRPQLLIADEPTTGLDVTTQKAVMDLMVELTRERGMSTILITHDLGLAAAYCDRVVVMEKGKVVETAPSQAIFTAPAHPYTRKLMRATPRPGASLRDLLPADDAAAPRRRRARSRRPHADEARRERRRSWWSRSWSRNIRARATGSLRKVFGRKPATEPETFRAVDGISFVVDRGESVGLVGESGCGKSTTSTMVMRLIDKTDGVIMFDGEDIGAIPPSNSPGCRCASASRWCSRIRPTASIRASPRRAPSRTRCCGWATSRARRRARALRGARPPGRPAGRAARPVSAPALRRAEGARRHRARDRAQSRSRHPGRADRRARCVGAGGRAQSAAGPQGVARA